VLYLQINYKCLNNKLKKQSMNFNFDFIECDDKWTKRILTIIFTIIAIKLAFALIGLLIFCIYILATS